MNPKRILVVDDETSITHLLKLNLQKTGRYTVRTENQGLGALVLSADGVTASFLQVQLEQVSDAGFVVNDQDALWVHRILNQGLNMMVYLLPSSGSFVQSIVPP